MLELLEEYLAATDCECFAGGYSTYCEGSEMTFINACVDLTIGFCAFSQTLRIIHIHVAAEQRGCGLGSDTVRSICRFAQDYGLDVHAVHVLPEAERFWEEYVGFQPDPHNPDGFLYPTRETARAYV